MKVQLPLGDVVDKVTILLLKRKHISEPGRHANVCRELSALRESWAAAGFPPMETLQPWAALCSVNEELWDVEDALRGHESRQDFGPRFVALARSVYHLNDRRAALKRDISASLGSELVEEKAYEPYQSS